MNEKAKPEEVALADHSDRFNDIVSCFGKISRYCTMGTSATWEHDDALLSYIVTKIVDLTIELTSLKAGK